jgi:hypothetical protein
LVKIISIYHLHLRLPLTPKTRHSTALEPRLSDGTRDLDHLYLAQRLNDLRKRPTLISYRKLKTKIFPAHMHGELVSAIQNGLDKQKFVLPIIDIFLYERDNASIEALMRDGFIKATDVRYHDAIVYFGTGTTVRKEQQVWAMDQIVEGFGKSLDILAAAVHAEFPNLAGAYDMSAVDTRRLISQGLGSSYPREKWGTLLINRSRCMPEDHDWKVLAPGEEPAASDNVKRPGRFSKGPDSLWRHSTAWSETAKKFDRRRADHKALLARMADSLADRFGPFILWHGFAAGLLADG